HGPPARQLGSRPEGTLGGAAFPGDEDHHDDGARQARSRQGRRRSGRRPAPPQRAVGGSRRRVHPPPQRGGDDRAPAGLLPALSAYGTSTVSRATASVSG